jgi:dTDP-4-amino-4,6-dideoxygalactose transaminase
LRLHNPSHCGDSELIPISKPYIGDAEKKAVMAVLESGFLVQGARTSSFEERFAQVCGTKYAIAVSSGTSALLIALLANGIGPGAEVITTAFTFAATANAILFAGAKPVFVDIEEDTFNLDTRQVEQAITQRTKAILPVHLYGYMCDMAGLEEIARRYHLPIIEDACQAITAAYHGRFAGSFGTGTFSLYATKNIMTGEGGMITTNDEETAEKCRLLRNHGMTRRYYHDFMGFNFRMTDIQAAIGLAQLDRLAGFTAKRRANAEYYNNHIHSVVTPRVKPGYEHVWHQYTIRVNGGRKRDNAVKKLSEADIGTGIYYPVPLHHQQYIREAIGDVSLPVTEKMSKEVISIPIHPLLTPQERELIVAQVNEL